MIQNNEIGYNIKLRREYLGLSQKTVAQYVGIKKPLYVAFEEGKRQVSVPYLARIAEVLDCRLTDFLQDDNEVLVTTESLLRDLPIETLSDADKETIFLAKSILKQAIELKKLNNGY